MKKLSIITINYNNKAGLQKTIESVINQSSFNDVEYVVIDGESSDGSIDIISLYSKRISYWSSEKDSGIYNAMNKGVCHATGEYCLFLNSGDCFHADNVIEIALSILSGEDIIIGRVMFGEIEWKTSSPLSLMTFYNGSIPHQGTFIKRSLLITTPYDESLRIVSDWKFFIQTLVYQGSSYKISELIVSDYDTNGISSLNKTLCNFERDKVLADILPNLIAIDYKKLCSYNDFGKSNIDKFFMTLRFSHNRFYRLIYSIDIIFLRFAAIFRKNFRAMKSFPFLP